MNKVIFACIHNAGRSQMAAAFFNKYVNPKKASAISAGTNPAKHVHPVVAEVMWEIGIDLSQAKPQFLDEALAKEASILFTMGCKEKCPFVVGLKIIDWPFEDPKDKPLELVRLIRNEIEKKVKELLKSEGWDF